MTMMTMMVLDVLQVQGVDHDHKNRVRRCEHAKMFLQLQQQQQQVQFGVLKCFKLQMICCDHQNNDDVRCDAKAAAARDATRNMLDDVEVKTHFLDCNKMLSSYVVSKSKIQP